MNLDLETVERISRLLEAAASSDEKRAFIAGYDCGKNGPNQTNCHFAHFGSPQRTAAWEKGKEDSITGGRR